MGKLINTLYTLGKNIWLAACMLTILIAGMDYIGLVKATKVSLEIILLIGFAAGVVIPLVVLLIAFIVVTFKK